MFGHRVWYLAALTGCGIFYIAYGEWFSWIALLILLGLPWLSLLVSLPAIVTFRVSPGGADALTMGTPGELWLLGSSPFPLPPFRGKLYLRQHFTGQRSRFRPLSGLPVSHCGGYCVTVEKARVCDYLGLFAFPVKHREQKTLLIRPLSAAVPEPPDLKRFLARSWRPKNGGGFSENYELRLYRPGDSLNQVHWKLSAKTGKLTIREPMEPRRGLVLLTMNLRGTPEKLDRKLGRLLWLGGYLLERNAAFELRVLTGNGIQTFPIDREQALNKAVDTLLCSPCAQDGSIREKCYAASWQYHIGGDAVEA